VIVLDTNVVSEAMKPHCDPGVKAWLHAQATETLFLTATSLAELLLGVALAPPGKRRDLLEEELCKVLDLLFAGRILAFDEEAAKAYAKIVRNARTKGRPIAVADGQIAAIAQVHGFAIATRDTGPFNAAGVSFIDPWRT
jgi:hypothetical protein